MKKRTMKLAALAMTATMVLGSTMTAFGAENTASTPESSPIYNYDISTVVVPTKLAVAFNPNGFDVTVNGGTVTDEIVSLNYGVLSKSDKDKKLTIALQVTDPNGLIQFVDSEDGVDDAEDDTYAIFLQAEPIKVDTTDYELDDESGIEAVDGTALAKVTATVDDLSASAITLAQSGKLGFNLAAADFTQTAIDLETQDTNDVSGSFTISEVTADGFGGFTFTGAMNNNTNWALLTKPLEISAVYSWETLYDDPSSITYGVTVVDAPATFSVGSGVGEIKIDTKGYGDSALASIYSIEMDYQGTPCDVYNAFAGAWEAAAISENGLTITLPAAAMKIWADASITTADVKITYVTANGGVKVVTLEDVKTK